MAQVMVVDDEDILVELIAALIEDLGHAAIGATNGFEALNFLSQVEPPDLIISDIMMPRMSGIELVRAIRADARMQRVPIILMSAAGWPRPSTVADGFIAKPFELDALANLIERSITECRLRRA